MKAKAATIQEDCRFGFHEKIVVTIVRAPP